MKVTVIDLFCGAGGFSEGFRQAGCSIVLGVDNWKPAIKTFKFNFPNSNTLLKDIGSLSENEINTLIPNTDYFNRKSALSKIFNIKSIWKSRQKTKYFFNKNLLKDCSYKKKSWIFKSLVYGKCS